VSTVAPPPANLSHRPARPADAEALFGLSTQSFSSWGGYGETIIAWSRLNGVRTWVIEAADQGLLGFVMFAQVQLQAEGPILNEILAIATAPSERKRGVGQYLLELALADLRQWRGGGGEVWLTVAADNAPAQTLFRRAGFLQRAVPSASYPNGVESHRMVRSFEVQVRTDVEPKVVRVWAEPSLR